MDRRALFVSQIAFIGLFSAGAAGCANLASFSMGDLPVPPGSPVAVAATDAVRNPGPYPTFSDIPKAKAGEAAPQPIALVPDDRNVRIDQALAALAVIPPGDPAEVEAIAARIKASLAGAPQPLTQAEAAEVEAFARAARARATPPPPPS